MTYLRLSLCLFLASSLMGANSCAKGEGRMELSPPSHAKLDTQAECKADDDCTTIKSDCCDCFQGGKQRAVAKSMAQTELDKLIVNCNEVACIQMISNDPSCRQKAYCQSGHCILREVSP